MKFSYHNPVHIHFGTGRIESLPDLLAGRGTLLVADAGFHKLGWDQYFAPIANQLVEIIDDVQPNPSIQYIESIYRKLRHDDFDVIVAIGGGSAIDTAKALSVIDNGEGFEHLFRLISSKSDEAYSLKPVIAIPTTAGTGSEVTPWATLWDSEAGRKHSLSLDRLWCESTIVDPQFTYTLPHSVTMQGALDALSHSLESLWNKNANPISTAYAISAARTVVEYLPHALAEPNNREYRECLMLASLTAGLAFSNTQTAIAHAISYHLTMTKGVPHGIACSFALPDILGIVAREEWMRDATNAIFGEPSERKLREMYTSIKAPMSLAEFGLTSGEVEELIASITSTPRAGNSLVDARKVAEELRGTLQ